jgi:hypothetical protein
MAFMTIEAGPPTELEVARERLARSREQIQQHFQPGGEGPVGALPIMRGLAVKGVKALISGPGPGGSGLQVGLAVASLLMMFLTRKRARGRSLGLMLSLAIALMRFSRRR